MLGTQLPKIFHWVRWGMVVALAAGLLAGPVPVAHADTSVCGAITVDTTWGLTGNNYIVTCQVQVMQNVKLTIEPGVRVYFNPDTGLRIDGELIAHGVTFGSANATPAPGDWGRIFFMATSNDALFDANGNYLSGSILKDSAVVYGGGGVEGSVMTYGASPFFSGNSILLSASRGIFAQGRSANQPVVMRENFISNNKGGIYVSAGEVISNTIQGNSVSGQGGGILAVSSIIEGNSILDNVSTSHGGGISAESCETTNNTISGNTINGGSSDAYGGGVYASGGSLAGNTILSNRVNSYRAYGGGVFISAGVLTDNLVDGNTAAENAPFNWDSARGGGIYASLSTLSGNAVTNNIAISAGTFAYGGGIYATGGSISGNTVTGNTATAQGAGTLSRGGGIYAEGGTLSSNTVRNNNATGGGDSQGGGVYGQLNTLQLNTLTGNSANLGGAIYSEKGTVTHNTVLTNTTTLTGTVYVNGGTALDNTLRNNQAAAGGGLYGYKASLNGNTMEDNHANLGAGIFADQSTLQGNTLTGNTAITNGGGLYARGGIVTNNRFQANSVPSYGHGSGAYLSGVTDFSYNDVVTNTGSGGTVGGVSISGQPMLQYNNMHGNQPYDAEVVSSLAVSGTLNYWGSLACLSIPNRIYDGNDAPGRGKLTYAPSLYSPVPVAQLNAPTGLTMDGDNDTLSLSWTPLPALPAVGCRLPGSSAPDLTYRVYYSNHSACGPFDGDGLPQGSSPIQAGAGSSLMLSGLSSSAYYFSVTAVDYLGRESAYSNVMVRAATEQYVYLPLISVQE